MENSVEHDWYAQWLFIVLHLFCLSQQILIANNFLSKSRTLSSFRSPELWLELVQVSFTAYHRAFTISLSLYAHHLVVSGRQFPRSYSPPLALIIIRLPLSQISLCRKGMGVLKSFHLRFCVPSLWPSGRCLVVDLCANYYLLHKEASLIRIKWCDHQQVEQCH